MRAVCFAIGFIGCHAAPVPDARVADEGPCDLIAAILAIDNVYYQRQFHECAHPQGRNYVELGASPSLIPPQTDCPGRSFEIYRRERGTPEVTWLIPHIDLVDRGRAWQIIVTSTQPDPVTLADGSFESTNSYCAVSGGYVTRRGGRWITYTANDPAAE